MLKYDKLIRPIAISIIRKNNSILVYERTDDISKDKFYRLVGGLYRVWGAIKRCS